MELSSCARTVDFKLIVQILIEIERFLKTEVNLESRVRNLGPFAGLHCQEIGSEAFKMLLKVIARRNTN